MNEDDISKDYNDKFSVYQTFKLCQIDVKRKGTVITELRGDNYESRIK